MLVMKRSNDDEDDGDIFSFCNKKPLTFKHQQLVLSSSSDEDDDEDDDDDDNEVSFGSIEAQDDNGKVIERILSKRSSAFDLSPPPSPNYQNDPPKFSDTFNVLAKLRQGFNPSTPDVVLVEDHENTCQKVKVRLHGKVHKFNMNEDDPFLKIYSLLAEQEGVPISQLVLNRNQTPIEMADTAKSLNITICDIIECIIFEEHAQDLKTISICVQTNAKHSKTAYNVLPNEPLRRVLQDYCVQRSQPLQTAVFYFDGEPINVAQSPADIEIEDGDVIDAKFKQ